MCQGCNAIKDVYCYIEVPSDINSNNFTQTVYANATLHVPFGTRAVYSSSTGWKEFKTIVENAEIIKFSDQETKFICIANWDTNEDGELDAEEAKKVTFLGTVFKQSEISSFNELKYFTGLTSIGQGAFSHSTVRKLTIPENVTVFEKEAFLECKSLTTLNIPEKVISIGQNALSGCTSMISITVDESNSKFCDIDGVLFTKDKKTLLQFPAAKAASYNVPTGTVALERDAFYKSKLESVILPASLRELGYDAFGYSTKIKEIFLPEGLTTIDNYVFNGCSSLETLRIPASVNTINNWMCHNCKAIKDVYCDIERPFGINKDNFEDDVYNNAKLHIPFESREFYSSTMGWKEFKTIVYDGVTYTLTIQSSSGGTVTYNSYNINNGSQTFTVKENSPVILNISPDTGYELTSLTVNGANVTSSVSDGQYPVGNLTANTTIVAQFSKKTYTLSIQSSGNGKVMFDNHIIENASQSFSVEFGTSVTLTLTSENGYRLSSLSINGTSDISSVNGDKYVIPNITSNKSVVAVFEPIPVLSYTLNIQSSSGGTIVFNGHNVTDGLQQFTVNEGSNIELSVVPDIGYELATLFVGKKDVTEEVADGKYIIKNISSNTNVSATFAKRMFTLQIEASGNGTVTYNSTPVKNNTNSFSVTYGESITLTIKPNEGYQIAFVTLNGANVTANVNDGEYEIPPIMGNNTIKVVFEPIPVNIYSLTILSSFGGSITYNGRTISGTTVVFNVNEGAQAELTVTPDLGFQLSYLILNETDVTVDVKEGKFTINDISENTTVEALFTKQTFPLTIQSTGKGKVVYLESVISNDAQTFNVDYGNSVSFVIMPDDGYKLAQLTVNGNDVTAAVTNNVYTIPNITDTQTVNAVFEQIPEITYTLTLDVGTGGMVAFNGAEVSGDSRPFNVNEGTSTTLTIKPNVGYRLKSLLVNDNDKTAFVVDNIYVINDIYENITVKVEFEPIPLQKFTLEVTVSSGGQVEYDGIPILNETRTFTVVEGSSVTLYLLANTQYKLGKITVNDTDKTSSVRDNSLVIDNIGKNLKVNVIFEIIMDEFTYNGINYGIISSETPKVKVLVGDYTGHLEIPATVPHNGITWYVAQIADNAFSGNSQLVTVSIPPTVEACGKNIFGGCNRLCAIIWQPQIPLNKNQTGHIENSNLLFYTSSKDLAPDGVENIIVNNHANQIKLIENNEFYCRQTFIADKISFTHHFTMETGIGESKGWETLVLPFDVKKITHATKGEIVPFATYSAGDGTLPFWLYCYDSMRGFIEATSIEANRPYVISMPNNIRYAVEYILAGYVEFSSENASVMPSDNLQPVMCGDIMFWPTFSTTSKDVKALNVNNDYISYPGSLNPGSTFIFGIREARPFEAYMTSSSGSNASVAIFDDLPTRMGVIPVIDHQDELIKVYSISGQMVKICNGLTSMEDVLRGLTPGVYVVNGQKMVVK